MFSIFIAEIKEGGVIIYFRKKDILRKYKEIWEKEKLFENRHIYSELDPKLDIEDYKNKCKETSPILLAYFRGNLSEGNDYLHFN